ncbi:MAG: site-specific integrase [Weeksellaceae bacterium]|nr:site-specific integrase [Weeksellaceae bacterium]
MIIKRNIVFDLENRKTGGELITENIPIRMRITYAGNRLEIFTGIRVDRNKWDSQKKKVKANTFNKFMQSASDINGKLSDYENEIQNIFKKFELEEEIPTKEEVRFIFNSVFTTEKSKISSKNFFDYYDEFITDNGRLKSWSESTFAKLATVKNHLSEFKHKLSFSFFNEKGLTLYSEFLRDNLKMRNSTIEKQISFLKWFLKWAKAKGYNKNLAFETYKPKLKSTQKKIIFLTQEELKKLNDYEIPAGKNYLERVRDVFLFLCYSGIRYSDAFNLKRSDVKDGYIEITTQKTADSLIIELNKKSKQILEKYNEIPFPNNKALPVISNQKMNEYIQELAKLAEIDEPIRLTYYKGNNRIDEVVPKYDLLGSHAGRRTFICTALSLGIPVNVIMKWTGHSDYKSMKPYIDIADNIKANAMKKFDLI